MLLRGILLQTFLVIVASFVLATVKSQMVSVYPPSIGAQRDEQNVVLNCNVTGLGDNKIVWVYYPTWQSTGFTIYSTYNNVTNDPGNFIVYPLTVFGDTHSLNLVIKTVKPELATRYLCGLTPILNVGRSVQVIALDPMECPNSGTIEYDEGNEANLSCSVNYYETLSTMVPNVIWYRNGQPVPGAVTIIEGYTRKTVRLVKNVTSADDDQELVCIVDFANSDPDYTDNCSTVFYVRHSVSELSFYPPFSAEAPMESAVGETINCTASGRPAPTIVWYDEAGNLLSEWIELVVTEDMLSWKQPITLYCRAKNTIDYGVTFAVVVGNYTFNAVEADIIVSSPSPSGGVEAWVIAVVVIVIDAVVLAAIAIAIFFIIRHRYKKTNGTEEDSDRSRTNIGSSNSPQLYEPVLSAQNLNAVPTYAQLTTSTNVDVIRQSLSDTSSYDYPAYQLNANESSFT